MLFIDADGAIRAMLTGSTNAVNLALSLIATYGFWLGFFKLLESTGIAKIITRLLRPTIRFLFDNIDDETESLISMNMSANLLGLGNASTPVGISAMQKMDLHNGKTNTNMIMLVVISATSLQLIPSTVIGMRIAHGSLSPTAFLLPSIISTIFSTLVGILLVKIISSLTKK
jgi:spore maturation protein A